MGAKTKALPWHGVADGGERVVAEVLCVECGAALRGQRVSERCVSCGHPVSDSVHGDYLVDSDRDVVRRLADSANFVKYGAIALAAVIALALLVRLVAASDLTAAVAGMFDLLLAGGMISPVVSALGLVILNPGKTINFYLAKYSRPREFARLLVALALLVGVASLGMLFAQQTFGCVARVGWIFIPLAAFLLSIEQLMRRVPNVRLARRARTHMVLTVVLALITLAALLIRVHLLHLPQWQDALIALMLFASLSAIGCTISGLRLLVSSQQALFTAAR